MSARADPANESDCSSIISLTSPNVIRVLTDENEFPHGSNSPTLAALQHAAPSPAAIADFANWLNLKNAERQRMLARVEKLIEERRYEEEAAAAVGKMSMFTVSSRGSSAEVHEASLSLSPIDPSLLDNTNGRHASGAAGATGATGAGSSKNGSVNASKSAASLVAANLSQHGAGDENNASSLLSGPAGTGRTHSSFVKPPKRGDSVLRMHQPPGLHSSGQSPTESAILARQVEAQRIVTAAVTSLTVADTEARLERVLAEKDALQRRVLMLERENSTLRRRSASPASVPSDVVTPTQQRSIVAHLTSDIEQLANDLDAARAALLRTQDELTIRASQVDTLTQEKLSLFLELAVLQQDACGKDETIRQLLQQLQQQQQQEQQQQQQQEQQQQQQQQQQEQQQQMQQQQMQQQHPSARPASRAASLSPQSKLVSVAAQLAEYEDDIRRLTADLEASRERNGHLESLLQWLGGVVTLLRQPQFDRFVAEAASVSTDE